MGLIAEFVLSNPIMQEVRRAVPAVTVEVEDERPDRRESSRLVFWARGEEDDLERFFRELPDDPSIGEFETLSTLPRRRLFGVTLSPEGEQGLTYIDAIDLGVTFLDIEMRGSGAEYRAQVPNREALSNYRDRCERRDLSFSLRRLYRSEADKTAKYDLTPRQRDVLRRAVEAGYFEVPRETSTSELADEFGVSSQALSALIRRGEKALVRSTVADDIDA